MKTIIFIAILVILSFTVLALPQVPNKPSFSIDSKGNVQFPNNIFLGRLFCEQELAESSTKVVCSVEKIVNNVAIMRHPERTIIRNAQVIEIPFGAHPGASNGFYIPDLNHYKEYARYCRERKFNDYLKKYVFNMKNHEDYIKLIGKNELNSLKLKNK